MTEEKVTIIQVETKNTKAGAPMWTATTSDGKMSTFDKDLGTKLFASIGKIIGVEFEVQGIYKNLKRIIDETASASLPTAAQVPQNDTKNRTSSASMMIAYAKDLVVAGKIEYKDLNATAKALLTLYEEMIDGK